MIPFEGRTAALIDLSAIRDNVRAIRRCLRDDELLCAVVKANGYGHGIAGCYPAMKEAGVDRYAVAFWQEGKHLREAGCTEPIQILGDTPNDQMDRLITYDLIPAIFSLDMAEAYEREAAKVGGKHKLHLKIDTGMGRIGFACTDERIDATVDAIVEISRMPHLEAEGIFTHFSRADEADPQTTDEQYRRFCTLTEKLEAKGIHIPIRHADNSAAMMGFEHSLTNMARAGIILYGMYPSDEVEKDKLALRPALSWGAHVSFVKEVPAGTPISYGGQFVTARPSRIATVPVGYADGYSRSLSGKGCVVIGGQAVPICGRVCMDQMMVDVTDVPNVRRGSLVTLIGDGVTAEQVAALCDTVNYEVVCDISERVPRVYQ